VRLGGVSVTTASWSMRAVELVITLRWWKSTVRQHITAVNNTDNINNNNEEHDDRDAEGSSAHENSKSISDGHRTSSEQISEERHKEKAKNNKENERKDGKEREKSPEIIREKEKTVKNHEGPSTSLHKRKNMKSNTENDSIPSVERNFEEDLERQEIEADLPCRLHICFRGLELLLFNNCSAYDAVKKSISGLIPLIISI